MNTYGRQGEYRGFLPLLYFPVSGNQQVRFVSQEHTQCLVWMLSWCFSVNIYSDSKNSPWVTTTHSELFALIRAVFFTNALFCVYQLCIFSAILLPSQLIMWDPCATFSGSFCFWLLETTLYHQPPWLSTISSSPFVNVLDNAGPGTVSLPCLPLATSFNCEKWSVVPTFAFHPLTSY